MEYVLINKNGAEYKVPLDQFDFELVDTDERQMGSENCYKLHNEEFGIHCYLYEYPEGCFYYKSNWECDSETEILEDKIHYQDFFIYED